ncbi:hypothetical protein [Leptospira meyeri]|nr:hypothetical protein [Leptospira meyeri]
MSSKIVTERGLLSASSNDSGLDRNGLAYLNAKKVPNMDLSMFHTPMEPR